VLAVERHVPSRVRLELPDRMETTDAPSATGHGADVGPSDATGATLTSEESSR
jgi:hypothetical protein